MVLFSQRRERRFIMIALTTLIITILIMASFQSSAQASGKEDYKVVGYYTSWAPPKNLDPNKLTHINYAFADVCWEGKHGNPEVWVAEGDQNTWSCRGQGGEVIDAPNGTIVLGDPKLDTDKLFPGDTKEQPFAGSLNQLVKMKEVNPDLKTLISVGGWNWSVNLSLVAGSKETRETFAKSAVDFIRTYQMDGLDLDWEYPVSGGMANNHNSPEDKVNHTLLLSEIRKELDKAGKEDGKEYLLTIASSVSFSYLDNNELEKIAKIVDSVNIMTYDFNGGWSETSAHNAPLYEDPKALEADVHPHNVKAAVEGFLKNGVPADKIVLGMPFYGRAWGGCNAENGGKLIDNGGYQKCTSGKAGGNLEPGMYDFKYLSENMINKNGYARYWNEEAKVPYLYNHKNGEIVSYDDAESISHKVDYLKQAGLAGAMIWEVGQDDSKSTLLNTISSKLGLPAHKEDGKAPEQYKETIKSIIEKLQSML